MGPESFCLEWNNYQTAVTHAFKHLQDSQDLIDVTIMVEGLVLKAHRVVLSACSLYFKEILCGLSPWQHPVLIISSLTARNMKLILDYIYLGKVTVERLELKNFLEAAESLQIKGLSNLNRPSPLSHTRSEPGSTNRTAAEKLSTAAAEDGDLSGRPVGSADETPAAAAAGVQPKQQQQQMVRIVKKKRSSGQLLQPVSPRNNKKPKRQDNIENLGEEKVEVKQEPLDTENASSSLLAERNVMVVVKADPDDFHSPRSEGEEEEGGGGEGDAIAESHTGYFGYNSEAAPHLVVRNDLMRVGELGRCHFCAVMCPDKGALTDHLKAVHMPAKHALCENCENFFHVCAIQRHRLKCQARYQSDGVS